ncbi:hypothetical protein [Mucilaginibacter auburnensis]|nr:hypothetical protein [Mucilaginibacter auburnensis]
MNKSFSSKSFTAPESWRWRSENQRQEFTIKILKLTEDSLLAQYCAVYNNGQKLDCDFNENANIKAAFDPGRKIYTGKFKSFFNSGYGICSIKLTDNSLVWEIVKIPTGTYYAPEKCILNRLQNSRQLNKAQQTDSIMNASDILPLNYDNFSKKVKMSTSTEEYIKNNFNEHYQLSVDASAKLPSNGDFQLYLINNVSGDSDLLYLVTFKGTRFIDGLEIANSNGAETEQTVFSMDRSYKISLFTQDENTKILTATYQLNNTGKFVRKN